MTGCTLILYNTVKPLYMVTLRALAVVHTRVVSLYFIIVMLTMLKNSSRKLSNSFYNVLNTSETASE